MSETPEVTGAAERQVERIETFGEYVAALDKVLALARREIRIVENDLSEGGFNGVARFELLKKFLLSGRNHQLLILVRNTGYLSRECPRMQMLLRQFSHSITIHRTLPETRGIDDAFVIVDEHHLLRRYHTDYARGEVVFNDPHEAGNLRQRFDEAWAESEPGMAATTLGL